MAIILNHEIHHQLLLHLKLIENLMQNKYDKLNFMKAIILIYFYIDLKII
jgi:hypothetical protein